MSYREEWKIVKIEDIADRITSGGTPSTRKKEYYSGNIPWLKTQEINFDRIYSTSTYITELGLKKSSAKWIEANSVIMAMYGATAGKVAINKIRLTTNQACCNITLNANRANYEYLYYYLCKDYERILNLAVGAAQQNLSASVIKELKIELPPLPTQNRIASILSAFDEKIELNRQMNATLEAMAQAMFREMCLPDDEEELEEGWEWRKIGDIGVNKRQTVKKEDITEDDNYIGLEHVPRKQIAIDNWNDASNVKSNKYRFSKNDILFGKLRPYFHKIGVVPVDGVCSTDILVIQPKREEYFGFLLMHCFSDELVSEVNASSSGTRMPRTNWKALARYEIALPPIEIIKEFNHQIIDFVAKMNANTLENQALAKTRDLLLPKLMSGEIEV